VLAHDQPHAPAQTPKMTKMTMMMEHTTRPRHLLSHNPQPVKSQKSRNFQINVSKTGCATSHNQTATKKQPKLKLAPKTHPEKLWWGNLPQPQVNNKKFANTTSSCNGNPPPKPQILRGRQLQPAFNCNCNCNRTPNPP
jgi:hypothetical protein